jgi:hypothetical protein
MTVAVITDDGIEDHFERVRVEGAVLRSAFAVNAGAIAGRLQDSSILDSTVSAQLDTKIGYTIGGHVGFGSGLRLGDLDASVDAALQVHASSNSFGGIVGECHGCMLERLTTSGSVTGEFPQAYGGIVGRLSGQGHTLESTTSFTIENGLPTTGAVGGLIGYLDSTAPGELSDLRYDGSIVNRTASYTGGILGATVFGAPNVSHVTALGNVLGMANVGGIAGGWHSGTLAHAHSLATVEGGSSVGGLVGQLTRGTVSESNANAVVRGQYAGGAVGWSDGGELRRIAVLDAASVYGATSAGGVLGYASVGDTQIVDTFSHAQIGALDDASPRCGGLVGLPALVLEDSMLQIATSYASTPTTCATLGGLLGAADHEGTIIITDSFWNALHADASSGGGLGLDEVAMSSPASFTGFDFQTVWQMDDSTVGPFLRTGTRD